MVYLIFVFIHVLCIWCIGWCKVSFNECNATLVQIVWCHFDTNLFSNVDPNARLAHFATYGCDNIVTVVQFYAKHCVR